MAEPHPKEICGIVKARRASQLAADKPEHAAADKPEDAPER
jgi:hypothetical protein